MNLNLREDLYPEYPVIEGMKMKRGIKNVFEKWKEETPEMKQCAFDLDCESTFMFSTGALTKDKED